MNLVRNHLKQNELNHMIQPTFTYKIKLKGNIIVIFLNDIHHV